MPADLLPTRFKTGTWLLNKSKIVQWWKHALLFFVFLQILKGHLCPLLTLLHFLLPCSAFSWAFFCVLVKGKGEQIKKKREGRKEIQALGGFGCEVLVKVCWHSVVWWNLIWILRLVRQAVVIAFGLLALWNTQWYLWHQVNLKRLNL